MERSLIGQRSLVVAVTLGALVLTAGTAAAGREAVWHSQRMTVTRASVEPGAALPTGGDSVLVYFGADADGRIPADAVWQPAGAPTPQNRRPRRLEALVIELKDTAEGGVRGTSPEMLAGSGLTVTTLIDNPRVLVLKQRYAAMAAGVREHFHSDDVLLVYLRGGYIWPNEGWGGPERVRQGDIRVVPPQTLHTLSNAGSDPLELLVVIAR